jgi:transcriptional regulator with XRE-family HTH domain
VTDRELCRRFGENLRRCREGAGVSLDGLGDRANLHRSEVEKLENAKREPRLGTILKLAAGLRVSPCHLLEDLDASPISKEANRV